MRGCRGLKILEQRAFDISALADIDDAQYDALQPVQWPVNSQSPDGTQRLFADGKFYTPSGKARMIAVAARLPAVATDVEFPLVLNTGRMRDQWHTMTRTGKVPRLNAHSHEPYVQMHARDAQRFQLHDGGLARLSSRHGNMLARVQVSDEQRIGSVFVPMHWNDAYARSARVDALVAAITDPISGQPELKHTPVHVAPYRPVWQGFVLSRERLALPEASYCACTQGAGYWRHEIAGEMRCRKIGATGCRQRWMARAIGSNTAIPRWDAIALPVCRTAGWKPCSSSRLISVCLSANGWPACSARWRSIRQTWQDC